jgi:hypothetical protein
VGHGKEYLYQNGVICILTGSIIRVLNADASTATCEINLSSFDDTISEGSSSPSEPKVSLLSCNEDLVAVHYEKKGRPSSSYMLILRTNEGLSAESRLLKTITLESSYKLFARVTAECIYFGTHSAEDDYGHHEWALRGVALSSNYEIPCEPLQLEKFFGTDIGSTIAFEIHGEYFYAVSNQTSFEVEEIDWTSFYHCVRFPLRNPTPEATEICNKVYRRQHNEGPIHDSWTDITLQFDEATNQAMIVEARREWLTTTSRQQRTFYISPFEWETTSPVSSEDGSPVAPISQGPPLPSVEDDAFVGLLESNNNPNWAPEERRPSSRHHPETTSECGATRSFILARTKFKGYNYSCSSFFDFVEDERCCSESSTTPCLRIRIGTRKEAPMVESATGLYTLPKIESSNSPYRKGDVAYRHSPIRMWPPPSSQCACSRRLHRILNPALSGPSHSRSMTGTLDERRFVYMVRPTRADNALGAVVVINFTRGSSAAKPNEAAPAESSGGADRHFEHLRWDWTPGACRKGACR